MFLNSVILVLQEIIEAALLISVMLVLAQLFRDHWGRLYDIHPRWLLYSAAAGLLGSGIYGHFMPVVSQWFDYVGLEVMNALIQLAIILWLLAFAYGLPRLQKRNLHRRARLFATFCMVGLTALVIVREGSEIFIFVSGVLGQSGNLLPVLMGSVLAGGIGISGTIFLYYSLISLPSAWTLRLAMMLLALFAGNMAAQAVLLLTQADWLPYTPQLWDSSSLVREYSVVGQLLYALVGYEANPSLLQLMCYLAGAILIVVSPLFRRAWTAAQPEMVVGH